MIVTFFGHADFCDGGKYEEKVLRILESEIGEREAEIYLGGYGFFDSFAFDCAKKYKGKNPKVQLTFVTPYLTESYQKNHLQYKQKIYDKIVYPEIENVPLKYAISYRNKYMVEKADVVIAYVNKSWGGAYMAYKYAKRRKKKIFNLIEQ